MRKYNETAPIVFLVRAKALIEKFGVEKAEIYLQALEDVQGGINLACFGDKHCYETRKSNPSVFLSDRKVSHRMEGFIENNNSLIGALKREINKKSEPHNPVS